MFIMVDSMNDSLRAARVATFVYFSLCGTPWGTWVVKIPAIEERVDITHATLGDSWYCWGWVPFSVCRSPGG